MMHFFNIGARSLIRNAQQYSRTGYLSLQRVNISSSNVVYQVKL